jgi:short-subunit dehydrogenase
MVNVLGFAAMVNLAVAYLEARGSGHLVGISSLAALQGVRYRFQKSKLPVVVTDVRPGFVDTRMAKADRLFWVASPQTAARQIAAAIRGQKQRVYITRRWRLVAWVLRGLPDVVYSRL